LQKTNTFWFSLYAAGSAFCLYTCVYAFRKAFSAATFDDLLFAGINYKIWLVVFQVIGYACSKFIGIKIIAELNAHSRKSGILLMTSIAGISLFLFAITPAPYNIVFLFTNGLPLGMIWGMIFGYLEGRKNTELLGAGLSVSFIFSSGFVKSVGSLVMHSGVSQWWMPFVTGCLFFVPLLGFLWLLDQLPPPNGEDEAMRTKRQPMDSKSRKEFALMFAPGLVLLIVAYMLLTAVRDFRDNFSAEIWNSLGYSGSPEIFTLTEIPISIFVLIVMGSMMFIRNNQAALITIHYIVFIGMALIGLSTYLFEIQKISAPVWMILIGTGLYLGYVPFNCIFFERLMAAFKYSGTIGFVMYLADSFGYLGSVAILFYKEFGYKNVSWLNFFLQSGYVVAFAGSLLILASLFYFHWKYQRWKNPVYKPAIDVS
jgi:hypothetical protein